jgi:hypothetical protein
MERLVDLSVSMFEWVNVPDTIDTRFLELTLFHDGQAVFFNDEELGFLCLQSAVNGRFNVYRIPVRRRAYAVNGYQRDLTDKDSVLVWNNLIHSNSVIEVRNFAQRLYNLDRIIDVNVNAQKTPVMIQATEQQRLTLLNLYKAYDGNAPFIFGDKNLDLSGIKAISTGAPYLADKLYELKTEIWNEALTYLGISNVNIRKKERLITDEVNRLQGGTIASRYSRLQARRQACEEINRMFDLDIWVNYREDFEPESNMDLDPLEVINENE